MVPLIAWQLLAVKPTPSPSPSPSGGSPAPEWFAPAAGGGAIVMFVVLVIFGLAFAGSLQSRSSRRR